MRVALTKTTPPSCAGWRPRRQTASQARQTSSTSAPGATCAAPPAVPRPATAPARPPRERCLATSSPPRPQPGGEQPERSGGGRARPRRTGGAGWRGPRWPPWLRTGRAPGTRRVSCTRVRTMSGGCVTSVASPPAQGQARAGLCMRKDVTWLLQCGGSRPRTGDCGRGKAGCGRLGVVGVAAERLPQPREPVGRAGRSRACMRMRRRWAAVLTQSACEGGGRGWRGGPARVRT